MKRALLISLVGLLVCSCANKHSTGPTAPDPPDNAPTYADIAAAQNTRVDRARQLYGVGTISVEWTDDKGQKKREGGEGNLIFRRPGHVAMLFRKLGKVYVWAGSDSDRLWLIVGGDDSTAYIARLNNLGQPCCEPIPMPVYPAQLLGLYGLIEFPTDQSQHTPTVGFDAMRNLCTVEIQRGSLRWRYGFDVDNSSLLPIRVELIGADDEILVRSRLENYDVMTTRDLGPGLAPSVPTWMTVVTGPEDNEARLVVKIAAPSDVPQGHREMPSGIFNFDAIRNNMRPTRIEVLDRDCDNPALSPQTEQ